MMLELKKMLHDLMTDAEALTALTAQDIFTDAGECRERVEAANEASGSLDNTIKAVKELVFKLYPQAKWVDAVNQGKTLWGYHDWAMEKLKYGHEHEERPLFTAGLSRDEKEVIAKKLRMGGEFAACVSRAYEHADLSNRKILEEAFDHLFEKFSKE